MRLARLAYNGYQTLELVSCYSLREQKEHTINADELSYVHFDGSKVQMVMKPFSAREKAATGTT